MIMALVIEKNKLIQWSLKETLSDEGYKTDAITSPDRALNRILKNPYSLIIFGLDMIEEDSLRILDQVNKMSPSTRLVVLTSEEKHQIELLLSDLNVTSIIEKPFGLDAIRAIARES